MSSKKSEASEKCRRELDNPKSYAEVWTIVRNTVDSTFGKRRSNMMLFLDDLPLQLGAYYPVGTNNIVLNRSLLNIVEASIDSKVKVNALIYNLLLHEYLHALGELSEVKVRCQVVDVAKKCFGDNHEATILAKKTPWILLKDLPLGPFNVPVGSKGIMEIVKDFENSGRYVV